MSNYTNTVNVIKYEEKSYQDAVIRACMEGNLKTIQEYLIDHKVNDPLYTGWTLLLYAASSSNAEVIQYLLAYGADPNCSKGIQRYFCLLYGNHDYTPLMALCNTTKGSLPDHLNCLSMLLQAGAKTNTSNKRRQTALMCACKIREPEFIAELIKHTGNIDTCDNEGQTALMYAVIANKPDTVELLLKNQVDVTIKNARSLNAKEIATLKGYNKIIHLLYNDKDEMENVCSVSKMEQWSDMFPRLSQADKNETVNSDVATMLHGMHLTKYDRIFKGMDLHTFLQLTDDKLSYLGMDINIHRKRFMECLYEFHRHEWKVQSIGVIDKSHPYTLYDGTLLLGNALKQISVISSAFSYIHNDFRKIDYEKVLHNDVETSKYRETFRKIENTLVDIKMELLQIKALANKISCENSIDVPAVYIGPAKKTSLRFGYIVHSALIVLGFFVSKYTVRYLNGCIKLI